MQPDQARDYVSGIFLRQEVPFNTAADGSHVVQYGSTAIVLHFNTWNETDTVVSLQAIVLEQLEEFDASPETYFKSLDLVNGLNVKLYFAKFCRQDTAIVLEYDLLASKMQAEELMNALSTVAGLADDYDDELKTQIGGKTWGEVEAESPGEAVET